MRGPRTTLIAVVVVTAVSATILRAQQMLAGSDKVAASAAAPDPSLATRSARQLLRNGLDYLETYQDYDRALVFLREAERRPVDLDPAEMKRLSDGIAKARAGLRDVSTTGTRVAGRLPSRRGGRPGAMALAPVSRPANASPGDAVQQASAEVAQPAEPAALDLPALPPAPPSTAGPAEVPPAEELKVVGATEEVPQMEAPKAASAPTRPADPIFLTGPETEPASAPAPAPARAEAKTTAEPKPVPASTAPKPVPESTAPKPSPVPAPAPSPAPAQGPGELPGDPPTLPIASEPLELPALPDSSPSPPPPAEVPPTAPAEVPPAAPVEVPPPTTPAPESLPAPPPTTPAPESLPAPAPVPAPVEAPAVPASTPVAEPPVAEIPVSVPAPVTPPVAAPIGTPRPTSPRVETSPRPIAPAGERRFGSDPRGEMPTPPAVEAEELPPLPASISRNLAAPVPAVNSVAVAPAAIPTSSLSESSLREVEEIARRQEDEARRNPPPQIGESSYEGGGSQNTSPLELPRAPSPTEPRPIKVIPVPEEFVPLPARQWDPNRKYWVAAATCHMPLYFQDAVLERYGQGVEQAIGPKGRFFSYPVDDPRQSNQRNQILQPMYSAGLFISQIALLPYNLIMDPPWEAEYDLGYYRPGDKIPGDTYYLPRTGIGPPLRGNRY